MRKIGQLAACCLFTLVLVAPASAAPGKNDEAKSASWVVSYALVALGTGLGVAAVCRSARRRKKIPDFD